MTRPIRGRFAPSPTGDLHLGNARTALLAWLQIRSQGGVFVLRVEDLDPGRSRAEYIDTQLDDLRWLGLDWDEGPDVGGDFGPYLQSERHPLYERALDQLAEQGRLFECYCSRKEIAAAASAPHDGDEGPVYPGTCRQLSPEERERKSSRRDDALRMDVPDEAVEFDDLVAGPQQFRPIDETGAFVVRRKDRVAAYQLAVTVDDAAMGITDVLRGADLLSSTARQILIYRALGLIEPNWAHVPLMLGADGQRLSKRHGDVNLGDLRERGVAPERVVGWLAWTAGLMRKDGSAGARSLVKDFHLSMVKPHPTIVDPAALF